MTFTAPRPTAARFAGLDGLRAVAVILVVVYHLFGPALLPGGFLGVDVFFVISGFLITSLLLRELAATGGIRLVEFWRRRARRLLPALLVVLAVCTTLAGLIGGDVLSGLGWQALGALTFSYNWLALAGDTGYFAATTTELFRNVWSLAVEEQFYLLWPLILPLFLLLPRRTWRAAAAAILALASATVMAILVSGGAGTATTAFSDAVTRAYFGTDTHAFGILLGVALAFALPALLDRIGERRGGLATGAGALAVSGVIALALLSPGDGIATFPGILLAASALTAVAILSAAVPGSRAGVALDVAPLRWIGDRSYGIYLWHWPLLVLALAWLRGTGPEAGVPVGVGVGVLAATLAAAELSYRFVETPLRRHGFRGTAARLGAAFRGSARVRARAVGAVAVTALFLGGSSAALAAAPRETSSEAVVAAGAAALEAAEEASPRSEPLRTPTSPPTPAVSAPSPTPVAGEEITAVGDSVMLAAVPGLLEELPGIQVDAAVSRSVWAGPGILESLAAQGQLRRYVVLALGTNGPVDTGVLQRMVDIAGPERDVILVNAHAPRDWIPQVNADLEAFAAAHPRVSVADWSSAIAPREDLLAGDRIHPGEEGGRLFARTVEAGVTAVEHARAAAEHDAQMREYRRLHHAEVRIPQ